MPVWVSRLISIHAKFEWDIDMATSTTNVACKNLVLDAGPLLMLSPLRGLAETFLTVPQVLEELKDKRAREHFEKLGLIAGVNVRVQSPDPESLAHGSHFPRLIFSHGVVDIGTQ